MLDFLTAAGVFVVPVLILVLALLFVIKRTKGTDYDNVDEMSDEEYAVWLDDYFYDPEQPDDIPTIL